MQPESTIRPLSSSFRDPRGYVFSYQGEIYRAVNRGFADDFDQFIGSELYSQLVQKGWLLSHDDVIDSNMLRAQDCHRILKPVQVPYISYPYEWTFSQLKDAAMLTLRIQALALKYGYSLNDASAFNIQFIGYRPVFIDILSFERCEERSPWVAYRQFCQHFLSPLVLMSYFGDELGKMSSMYIDGVPLKLTSSLLPWRSRLRYSIQVHIHLHAHMERRYADLALNENSENVTAKSLPSGGLQALLESLANLIQNLQRKKIKTEWGSYYDETNYQEEAFQEKKDLVRRYLGLIPTKLCKIQDLGANDGTFSEIAAEFCGTVISQDIDPVAVELNYLRCKDEKSACILPLVQDLTSPSPSIGWANDERDSFVARGECDVILALALIHHLAIVNNTPFSKISEMFSQLGKWLIIEFVPKSDSQVRRLLVTREDIFDWYDRVGFETEFSAHFDIHEKRSILGSDRVLYLMKSKACHS